MSKRLQIIDDIHTRRTYFLKDCETFIWAKSEPRYDDFVRDGVGGGNALMILGLFSTLGYYAKVYYLLTGGTWLENHSLLNEYLQDEKFKEKFQKLKKKGIIRKNRTKSINETEAFIKMMNDWGGWQYDRRNLRKIWENFRNSLAHMTIAKGRKIADDTYQQLDFQQSMEYMRIEDSRTVEVSNGVFDCFADALFRDVEKIRNWLCEEISDMRYPEENVDKIHDWIRKWGYY